MLLEFLPQKAGLKILSLLRQRFAGKQKINRILEKCVTFSGGIHQFKPLRFIQDMILSILTAFPAFNSGAGKRLDTTGEKRALRRKFSALRKSLPSEIRRNYDDVICQRITDLECFKQAEFIAAYVSIGAEVDLSRLFGSKPLLLPRFVESAGVYELVLVDHIERNLLPGKYGILEPAPELPAAPPDIVASRVLFLTPAVSCDRHGTRLGRGGGFYDRMLDGVKIPPVAVIYSCQLSETPLPGTAHDIPMGMVVTEREVIFCSSNI